MVTSDILSLKVQPSVSRTMPKEKFIQEHFAYAFLPSNQHQYFGPDYTFDFMGNKFTVHYIGKK